MVQLGIEPVLKSARHRTAAYKLTAVPGYPKKLILHRLAASPFWWVRYYVDGKTRRRSTQTSDLRLAQAFARDFYDELNWQQRADRVQHSRLDFGACAQAVIEQQHARVARGEMSAMMQQNDQYRLHKELLPLFGNKSVRRIDYFAIEALVNKLGHDGLAAPTIHNYLGLMRKVLAYAQRRGLIDALPQFPRLPKSDSPRGWFNAGEYRLIARTARQMAGQVWEMRKFNTAQGETVRCVFRTSLSPQSAAAQGQLMRRVEISPDLYSLIVLMANGFIRPTDIKLMQHRHVTVVDGAYRYLRLSLPTSKRHNSPIVTMPSAVRQYQRQRQLHASALLPDDYVFLPQYGANRRGAALTQLQRQFSVVLAHTGLAQDTQSKERSLYSLRHTCIMFRLLYGGGVDLLTLARNARTSPEMIDRFYASHLAGEMNVSLIHSKRQRMRGK